LINSKGQTKRVKLTQYDVIYTGEVCQFMYDYRWADRRLHKTENIQIKSMFIYNPESDFLPLLHILETLHLNQALTLLEQERKYNYEGSKFTAYPYIINYNQEWKLHSLNYLY